MPETPQYTPEKAKLGLKINKWDLLIIILVFGMLAALSWGGQQMRTPYMIGQTIPISLDAEVLPSYAGRTVLRMAIALCFSLLATFILGTLAAKSKAAERIILPFVDIMQSIPILGFLSISILGFIYLFPNSQLGPECAAIFAIFTCQVWNMILCFYQSLRTIPKDINEAARMLHLSPWQRFWRVEVPFATPSLIWNMMISLSAGWFFVVASEAISVNNQQITLPGIGSYIMLATSQSNYQAIAMVILTMFLVILIYDQLIFHPLIAWSEKFKPFPDLNVDDNPPWFLNLLQRATLVKYFFRLLGRCRDFIIFPKLLRLKPNKPMPERVRTALSWTAVTFWNSLILLSIILALWKLGEFLHQEISLHELREVLVLGVITTVKITVLIILASIIWVPIGVWVGLQPKVARFMQPIAQFLAAFPVNLVYPVLFMLIITYDLNVEIWTSPLMILGTQWYILFNVIAGSSMLSQDLRLVAKNFGVKGLLWWRKVIIPGIFPSFVTGAMTAAGGCWNASIVADVVKWGNVTLHAKGLGGYITEFSEKGDFPRLALGIAVMCLFVIVINRLVWQRLYDLAEQRYNSDASLS